ncbi:Oleic acid lipoxygenase [Colletotrichum sp. SAR 10_70]|nr:Oleic acid lipoxygenase [Colletotrichum sp. SAR 10_71]KAI8188269.1 Oleic acid lipoxygenase [Colletotrichum sp. SAR 10_70]
MSATTQSMSGAVGQIPTLHDVLNSEISNQVEDAPMDVWDRGVFLNELQRQRIALRPDANGATDGPLVADQGLKKGTYQGTQLALTEMYRILEESATSSFAARGVDAPFPVKRELANKQAVYMWSNPADGYPPHLELPQKLPEDLEKYKPDMNEVPIFNKDYRDSITAVAQAFTYLVPADIAKEGTPFEGPTIAKCEDYNRSNPRPKTDIMDGENIGNLFDWYSDARFAQQHLSGVNPSTITKASTEIIKAFADEAGKQGLQNMKDLLSETKDFLVQDYSYFRKAMQVSNEDAFCSQVFIPSGQRSTRYACAPIVIFQLHDDGRLHPLAITLDFKGSLENSINIFNKRLNPDDTGAKDEKDDWPWRYAKTCAQTADWARHEVATHLVDTHMIEEAIIVATNRTIPEEHILYEVLSPHWFRTLPLNKAARDILVPAVIARIAGFGPTNNPKTSNAMKLVKWSYDNFNFQDKYIPTDLKKRGFDLGDMNNKKYRNYPYATTMYLLWGVIRDFVKAVLATKFKSDESVQSDEYIPAWCNEIQTKGQIPTFPTITTVDQLIDAVTMCIHTASPQHTAVNYLQHYYYGFVASKPPALCTPLPTDLATLQQYTEKELTAALPIGPDDMKWKDWLLAAQLPELLSYKVDSQYNLITYAKSLYNVHKNRTSYENKQFDSQAIKEAAAKFFDRLKALEPVFDWISKYQTPGTVEYKVLQPELTAVSILI